MVSGAWSLPADLRAQIGPCWARLLAANPHLWDGRIIGVTKPIIDADGFLHAEAREDAYSVFLTWRDAGFPDIGMNNLFGSALIASSDGALIYGVMGADTANAGRVYPPGGSLEPRDVVADGLVDVARSTDMELEEETGLTAGSARKGALVAVFDGPRISIGQLYHFDEPSERLVARIRGNLDRQEHRELADVVAIRSRSDAERAGAVPYAVAVAEAFATGSLG
jgi:8-oxo-dGTP pyrophosphatase MutT (NUDIX family)